MTSFKRLAIVVVAIFSGPLLLGGLRGLALTSFAGTDAYRAGRLFGAALMIVLGAAGLSWSLKRIRNDKKSA